MEVSMLRFHSAGESHGPYLVGILEGLPAGIKLDEDFINSRIQLRNAGYGRGKRMEIETDTVEIFSGITKDFVTTGAPIGFRIRNRDWETNKTERSFKIPRPGHSDYAGSIKYNYENLAIPSERTSGRLTALDVVTGSITETFLKIFGVRILFFVTSINDIHIPYESFADVDTLFNRAINSSLLVPFEDSEEKIKKEIDRVIEEGDTLGGSGMVIVKNFPIGVGDYNRWEEKMDGLIAQAVMSVPTVKAVEIGRGKDASNFKGSEFQDRFLLKDGKIKRETNNAGGIEGGITNGEDITVKFYSKPIPTVRKGIRSVDLDKWVETQSIYVRSDTVVLPAVTLISASRISFVLASSFLKKFSGDHIDDVKASFDYYLSSRRHFWQR